MNRPLVKYVVRVALFATTVAALACSNSTAPAPVSAKNPALRDSMACLSGYIVVNGVTVCGDPG
jgi:hypothetical protein